MGNIYNFFLCEQGPPKAAKYQHTAVSLAEGLSEIGHRVIANHNYWFDPIQQNYLFDLSNDFSRAVANIVTHQYVQRYGDPFENTGQKWVLLDDSDGIKTIGFGANFRRYDFVLKTQFNKRL